MVSPPLPNAGKYTKEYRRRQRWRRVVTAMAAMVVFCTTYALILPAITMEHTCGLQEHTHDETCYVQVTSVEVQEPDCTLELHTHTAACYNGEGETVCGYADFVVHRHTDACYDGSGSRWCTLPEIKVHTHDRSCYLWPETSEPHRHDESCYTYEQGELLCQEHVHSEACYAQTKNLICPLEEDPGHTHDKSCVDETGAYLCGEEAREGHTHTDACFQVDTSLACGIESDHEHVATCYGWTPVLTCPLDTEPEPEPEASAEPVLICTEPEVVLHTHDDNCFDQWGNLICGKTQILEHRHDETCFTKVQEPVDTESLTCTDTSEDHVHSALCYGTWKLICDIPEHTHTEACDPQPEEPTEELPEESSEPQPIYYCGKEEHTHGETCYDAEGNLLCTLEEHTHTEECLTEPAPVYYCGKEEHTHGEACYDAEGNLICTLEAHTHTEECLTEPQPIYYCGREEHTHGETCYDAEGNLICTLEEHIHTESCLEKFYYCGKEEHTHGEVCYDADGTLICTLEEHTHTESCWTPPTEEELQAIEAGFREELEALEALETLTEEDMAAAQDLLRRVEEAYRTRHLSEEAYTELFERIQALLVVEMDGIAEPCYGTNWEYLRDSGWFQAYSGASRAAYSRTATGVEEVDYTNSPATKGTEPSDTQVNDPGGTNTSEDNDVTVSKVISGTDIENVFDITLTVETPQKIDEVISEPDMAVVIVMDISNTMKDNFGGVTRYAAAVEAAEDFLDKFAASNSLGVSKVGYVAFNTDAHQIFGLQSCTNKTQADALKNTMRTATGNIINVSGYSEAHNRFTNIEGGLKLAQDMLDGASNKNKFIILLTDGFPTTYLESGYKGYDPYDTTGRFYDHVLNVPCSSGTSYSDEAAIRARNMATSIKNAGTTIFSIGVDVGGQTIQAYIKRSEELASGEDKFSIVDRTGTTYEIGSATSTEAYKNWLRNSIGSGYYYDSTNAEGLKRAYDQIFEQIKTTVATASQADWVAKDPIPIQTNEIDFIGLYDKDGELKNSLTGAHEVSAENTASYASETITWDLKTSGYAEYAGDSGTTWYRYTLKYRIRLKTEDAAFVENQIYETNGTTTLQYRVVQAVNGSTTVSDSKQIEFPIPSVHGYLGELTFQKVDSYGRLVPGAEFTLYHAENCYNSGCRGDGTRVEIADVVASPDEETGEVTFKNIPSGHTYLLKETVVPDGYSDQGITYTVKVDYDVVTVTPSDGSEWNDTVINNTSYELPATGGAGTAGYRLGGAALCLGAGVLLAARKKRRRPGH